MGTLINKESTEITEKGLELTSGFCEVEIQRSQLDGKIAKIISGAGDLKVLFDEINEEEFLSLSSDNRFNVTHRPISDLEIIPSSPCMHISDVLADLHLINHLLAGVCKWSPTSRRVSDAKTFVTSLIKDNLIIIINIPSTQGAVLRVYNRSRGVDTEELAFFSSNIYQSILCAFPWAYVSPTLHKLLAHAPEIISTFNDGHGLENLSEERLEASNNYIRRYRDRLACKFSFEENLKDVFVRLISQSDLMLLMNRKFSIPRPPSSQGLRSSQDILVNTLIRDHEDHNDD
ncbi:hypothetical protein LOD99_8553 [Oopsacas minuta]|uniref:Uncharacterized protein n=1 Tax=Oopsacas minuta TaxID=111878 RepID=A0AAV7JFY4_9METZ|nr:hypothetical protein LOD99_8553 [Oopsacas minuta]